MFCAIFNFQTRSSIDNSSAKRKREYTNYKVFLYSLLFFIEDILLEQIVQDFCRFLPAVAFTVT